MLIRTLYGSLKSNELIVKENKKKTINSEQRQILSYRNSDIYCDRVSANLFNVSHQMIAT